MKRAYRQKEGEVAFTPYPSQNHPDIVMNDFDQTFGIKKYDVGPIYPEGSPDEVN